MSLIEIFMDFDGDDNPIISVQGVKGKACKRLTADLESKLGTVTHEEKTAEYKQTEVKHGKTVQNRA